MVRSPSSTGTSPTPARSACPGVKPHLGSCFLGGALDPAVHLHSDGPHAISVSRATTPLEHNMALPRRTAIAGTLALGAALTFAGTAAAQPTAQDSGWIVVAHQSNLTEIAAGQAAQAKASSAAVRDLGQMFVQDHTAMD